MTEITHIPNCQGLRSVGRKHPRSLVISSYSGDRRQREAAKEIESPSDKGEMCTAREDACTCIMWSGGRRMYDR